MDLLTLVTACALTVEPKVMHALIWEQSGGEPWSFSVQGQGWPRVFPTMQDAIHEARTSLPAGGRIRVGLTGLSNDARSTTTAMFVPCMNITFAARQIAQLIERCTAIPHFKADPLYCAIAVYRGSWERPDTIFADAVKASVVKGDAPNFDIPQDGDFDSSDIAAHTSKPDRDGALTAATVSSEDRERGWSSALFPAKQPHADTASADMRTTISLQKNCVRLVMWERRRQRPIVGAIVCLYRDHLNGGRDELFGHVSHFVARFRRFECEAGQRRELDRPTAG
jgi:hypothetical protein